MTAVARRACHREWTEGDSLSAGQVIMGVDVGSSSTKGALVTVDGRLLAEAERPMTITRPRPGWAEQDADGDWWTAFVVVCRELLAADAGHPSAVGVSGLGPCLVVTDDDGRPLRPAILYGIDTRAAREIEELDARLGQTAILERCGSPLTSQSLGPKLAWLAREEPELWARMRHWFTAGSYLAFRLTGEHVLDHHSASQCGPLYDVHANAWIAEWAEATAPGLPLPRLAWPQEALGGVSAAAAQATGLPQGIPVASGTIDSWAEVAASGLRGPGEALLVYGTTMFLLEVGTAARPDARLWSTTSFEPGARNLAGGIGAAGALATWFHGVIGAGSLDELFEEAAAAGPGAGGLLALPYFNGERTPLFDPDARGALFGLTTAHDRGHVLRALLEGAALAVRHNLEVMAAAGARITALRASGGGARDVLWPGIVSDVTGLPQRRLAAEPGMATGAAAGSALLAAIALGEADLQTSWARPEELRPPALEAAPLYDELYGLYRELYPATREQAHALARLQRLGEIPNGGAG